MAFLKGLKRWVATPIGLSNVLKNVGAFHPLVQVSGLSHGDG
jgi:hypothetical protein